MIGFSPTKKALCDLSTNHIAADDGAGNFYLLPDAKGYRLKEAHAQWLNLVKGGEGPWRTS